ncbi:acyl-CoA dehydrogenase domain protein [Sulfobacillus acidophilus TPY]|uniref:glutaryl-CoA dehydrogenase (ETF) n=1 Tax=Sulfobacillus acidophilus (strain ATCC 700253 / DSM 10332 / NAL) TaxID=679936 RepID=G8TSD7_SULAD|nr:acyl-CoA dehydrogenase domain protein [Sulfobacillus acidophilus TPY]AEW05549.1 Glutaryl-CoA dehydrogenase [Sulfobacillus acidophilus DSM 10332]
MTAFEARREDFYGLEADYPPESVQARDMVRQWVTDHIRPQAGSWWLEGRFPTHLIEEMARLGVFGPTLPEVYGGSEASALTYGLMMQELERGDSGLRSFASVQSGLAMYAIYRYGSEEQKQTYLPRMAAGQVIGCFGLTEPDAGSDPGAMRTTARRSDRGFILQGAKRWITNGTLADVAVIWAKDEAGIVRGFIVPTDTPGFTAREIHTKASMRMSVTAELYMDQVEVSPDAILPAAEGLGAPLGCLTQARYGIAWGTVGAALDCLDTSVTYTKSRIAFGRPIAATQLVQERLADMLSEVVAMQLRARQLARLYETGRLRYPQVSLAKRDNARGALTVARMARELLGGNGISVDYPPMRHLANLETVDTYEGTYEVHTLILGRDLVGENAF